MFHKLFK